MGFASKAEFFRFLALDYIQKLDRDLTKAEFDFIMKGLTDSIEEKLGKLKDKEWPSLEGQVADMKKRLTNN